MSAAQLSDYTGRITSEHADKPHFVAYVEAATGLAVDSRNLLQSMPDAFDVDAAIGAQLDACAAWVGAARVITVEPSTLYPMPAQAYDYPLSDAELRRFIKGRIAANKWDGTPAGILPVFAAFFAGQAKYGAELDNQDMTVTLYLTGATPTPAELAIVRQFLIPVRPSGVMLRGIWIACGGPLFGLDVSNVFIDGPDRGYFGIYQAGP